MCAQWHELYIHANAEYVSMYKIIAKTTSKNLPMLMANGIEKTCASARVITAIYYCSSYSCVYTDKNQLTNIDTDSSGLVPKLKRGYAGTAISMTYL